MVEASDWKSDGIFTRSSNFADCVVFLSEHKLENKTSTAEVQKDQTVVIITAVRTEQSWPSG